MKRSKITFCGISLKKKKCKGKEKEEKKERKKKEIFWFRNQGSLSSAGTHEGSS